jgi:hypothetical protein
LAYSPDTPFDSIEGAHQYIELLLETLEQVRKDVDTDIDVAHRSEVERREEALRLVAHKLERLSFHVTRSRRLLNDLRLLRRLLLEERGMDDMEKDVHRAAGAD